MSIDNSISATDMKDKMLFLSSLSKENQDEISQNWSEDNKNNYESLRKFAAKIAHEWFRQSFCQDGFCGTTELETNIKQLRTHFKTWTIFFVEYEKYEAALLFAYWLFFSGMALVYPVQTINFSKKMKEKFLGKEKTSTSLIFIKFLKSYAQAKGIPNEAENGRGNYYDTINEINNCIHESKENMPEIDRQKSQNVVLAAVKDKQNMIADCIEKHITKDRIRQISSLTFPELKDSDENEQKKTLLSILHAGLAKFYLNQGMDDDCKKEIERALELYSDNTLALIQREKLDKIKHNDSNTGEWKSYSAPYNNFKQIIKLMEKEGQFTKLPIIQIRIKFDANMELAYLYSKIGNYKNADKCYEKLHWELEDKKDDLTNDGYSELESILLLNRGRNSLDREDYNSAIKYLKELVGKESDLTRDIRSLAHMNLGLAYYAGEDDFEKAKAELITAIKIDPTNSHSYYNLGILYYMEEGSIEKAKKFIKKSLYTNVENIYNVENKDYDKFKKSLDLLSEGKNPNLGSGWWQWWFGTSKKKARKNSKEKVLYFVSKYVRKIIGITLLVITSALVIKLNYDLYLHDFLNLMNNNTYTIHSHTLPNTEFILLGINIALLLLPVISRIKIADVEIDVPVESKGNQIYHLMPLTNSIMRKNINSGIDFGLFIIDIWY